MKWLLDTNACIRYLNGRAPNLQSRLQQTPPADLLVARRSRPSFTTAPREAMTRPGTRQLQDTFLAPFTSLPFDDAAADAYATIRTAPALRVQRIGPNDLLIAAIAVANGVTLVTHNTGEFGRVPGLLIEDWEQQPSR